MHQHKNLRQRKHFGGDPIPVTPLRPVEPTIPDMPTTPVRPTAPVEPGLHCIPVIPMLIP